MESSGYQPVENEDLFSQVDPENEEFSPEQPYTENTPEGEDKPEEKVEDLFEENQEEEGEEQGEYTPTEAESVLRYLHKAGLIESDVDYSQYSDDDIAYAAESSINRIIEDKVRSTYSELPPVLRDMVDYHLSGGDISQFLTQISQSNGVAPSNLDMRDEGNQEYIVRQALASQGYDKNYIESNIEFLKQTNNLETHASAYYTQMQRMQEEDARRMAEEQRMQSERLEAERRESERRLHDFLSRTQDLDGIPLSARDKGELASYVSRSAYALEDGTNITGFQKDLYFDIEQDPLLKMQIALLLKNRNPNGGLDLSFLGRQAEKNVAMKARESLRRTNVSRPSGSGGTASYKKKSLSDYFD